MGFLGDLLSESSELTPEEGSRISDKPHYSPIWRLSFTFRFFIAGSLSLSPDENSTCSTTEPQMEIREIRTFGRSSSTGPGMVAIEEKAALLIRGHWKGTR